MYLHSNVSIYLGLIVPLEEPALRPKYILHEYMEPECTSQCEYDQALEFDKTSAYMFFEVGLGSTWEVHG